MNALTTWRLRWLFWLERTFVDDRSYKRFLLVVLSIASWELGKAEPIWSVWNLVAAAIVGWAVKQLWRSQ